MEQRLLNAGLRVGTAVIVLLILAACSRGDEERPLREDTERPAPGHALEPVEGVWFRVTDENPFGPGQEFAFIEVPVINSSETPITIRRVDALVDKETERMAEVTGIDVAPRPRGERAYVPLGIYHRLPPRSASAGCISQRVLPAQGYELEPKKTMPGAILVIGIRTLSPGTFRIRGQRVVYEQDGELRFQDLHFEIHIRVRAGAHRRPLHNESACYSQG